MKSVRSLLIVLGVIFAVLAVVAGLARTPAIQRWIMLRIAAGQPDLKLQLQSVSVGPGSLALRGLELERTGVVVKIAEVDADYSLWALLFEHEINISQLRAHGVAIDATKVSSEKAKADAAAPYHPLPRRAGASA